MWSHCCPRHAGIWVSVLLLVLRLRVSEAIFLPPYITLPLLYTHLMTCNETLIRLCCVCLVILLAAVHLYVQWINIMSSEVYNITLKAFMFSVGIRLFPLCFCHISFNIMKGRQNCILVKVKLQWFPVLI